MSESGMGTFGVLAFGVGHGDAILLRWQGVEKEETWSCLVDGGISRELILHHLREAGVAALDLVIGTHPDNDHVGGLIGLADEMNGVGSYWGPPLPAFERHLWLFGEDCQNAIKRCRLVEDSFRQKDTQILYPVEGYCSAPFGSWGPQIHVLSPAAKLVRHLLTSDDVSWLFASNVMPQGWMLAEDEELMNEAPDMIALDRALSTYALRPEDIPNRFKNERRARPEEEKLGKEWSVHANSEPEFFGDSVLNNTSLVTWIEVPTGHSNYRILLPGDQENWTYLLARHPRGLHADILKAPHHGGRLYLDQEPGHEDVLRHIRPRVVIVSANGQHGLPRSSIRDAAIRWGAAVMCTSERTQETIVGLANAEECCHRAMPCDGALSHNVELTLDSRGIRSHRRSCHPGFGSLPSPPIEVHQHIVNPSAIIDRLAEEELRRHITWVQRKLSAIHKQRQKYAAETTRGSEPLAGAHIIALAPKAYRPVLATHLTTVLSKGHERQYFWAHNDGSYRGERWTAYAIPTTAETKRYLQDLGAKTMILFPNAVDKIHRDPDSLVARLQTCGLAGFADAILHIPEAVFEETLWPAVVNAFRSTDWHCFVRDGDVAFSRLSSPRELMMAIALGFFQEEDNWSGPAYKIHIDHDSLLYSSSVLISGKKRERHEEMPFTDWECMNLLKGNWLPKQITFYSECFNRLRCLSNDLGVLLRSTIDWQGNEYSYSSVSWDRDKLDEGMWPSELVSAIEQNCPLKFSVEAPYLVKLYEASPELLDALWLKDVKIERLW